MDQRLGAKQAQRAARSLTEKVEFLGTTKLSHALVAGQHNSRAGANGPLGKVNLDVIPGSLLTVAQVQSASWVPFDHQQSCVCRTKTAAVGTAERSVEMTGRMTGTRAVQ